MNLVDETAADGFARHGVWPDDSLISIIMPFEQQSGFQGSNTNPPTKDQHKGVNGIAEFTAAFNIATARNETLKADGSSLAKQFLGSYLKLFSITSGGENAEQLESTVSAVRPRLDQVKAMYKDSAPDVNAVTSFVRYDWKDPGTDAPLPEPMQQKIVRLATAKDSTSNDLTTLLQRANVLVCKEKGTLHFWSCVSDVSDRQP